MDHRILHQQNPRAVCQYLSNKERKKLTGVDKHKYLKLKILRPNSFFAKPQLNGERNFDNLKKYLKKCVTYDQLANRYNLGFHICFGKILEEFFWLWKEGKENRNVFQSWQAWLKEHVGISSSQARRKRDLT